METYWNGDEPPATAAGAADAWRAGRARHGRTRRIPIFTAWQRAALTIASLLTVSACATGTIRDGMYRDPQGRFTVRVPPARWQPVSLAGAALSFRAPDLDAGIVLRVDCSGSESGPLPSVARHLFFGLQDKRVDGREPIAVSDASGVRTRLRARLDDRPVEVDGVTVQRGECLYDLMYVAPPRRFEEGRRDFDAFIGSWTFVLNP